MQNQSLKVKLSSVAIAVLATFTLSANAALTQTLVVDTERANVRTGPTPAAPSIGTVTRGFRVERIGEADGWTQVRIQTDRGLQIAWIKSTLLTQAPAEAVPEIRQPDRQFVTDFGVLVEVYERPGSKAYFFNGKKADELAHEFLSDLREQHGNSFLFSYSSGSSCEILYFWATADKTGISVSEPFGNCLESEVSVIDGLPTMDFDDNAGTGGIRCILDGSEVQCSNTGLNSSKARNPLDIESWIGLTVQDYLTAEELEPILLTALTRDELSALRYSSVWSIENFSDDEQWMFATAMREPYYDYRVMVGLNKKTSQVYVAARVYSRSDNSTTAWKEYWFPNDGIQNPVISNKMRDFMISN